MKELSITKKRKQYRKDIPIKLKVQNVLKYLYFNYFTITNNTLILDIVKNIFQIYLDIQSKFIENIHDSNICLCNEEKCNNIWYNELYNSCIINNTNSFWKIHCNSLDCHNIVTTYKESFVWDIVINIFVEIVKVVMI